KYFPALIESAKKFFTPHETLIFTDSHEDLGVTKQVACENSGYPKIILDRYRFMLSQKEWLSQFENILFLDTDVVFLSEMKKEEVFSDGITALDHPWPYDNIEPGWLPPYESRTESAAYVDKSKAKVYYQGCFVGGKSGSFLSMAE